jgi:REP element-mobilizing transposase RayT
MRKNQKQLQLDLFNFKQEAAFGGELLVGRRKTKRPLNTKDPIHLVLRCDKLVLKRHERKIADTWRKFRLKFGVKCYESSINSNHIHAVIRIHSQRLYNQFVQAFCGTIALQLRIQWIHRPFTRIVSGWGKAFRKAKDYVQQNWLETWGLVEYQPRKSRYPK